MALFFLFFIFLYFFCRSFHFLSNQPICKPMICYKMLEVPPPCLGIFKKSWTASPYRNNFKYYCIILQVSLLLCLFVFNYMVIMIFFMAVELEVCYLFRDTNYVQKVYSFISWLRHTIFCMSW